SFRRETLRSRLWNLRRHLIEILPDRDGRKMRLSLVLPVALIVLLSVVQFPTVHSQSPQLITQQGFGLNRSASLTVKIVFLGITPDELNSTYLKSNVTVPPLKYQTIIAGPFDTGVIFSFNYQLVFADYSTVRSFARYLSSIQGQENTFSDLGLVMYRHFMTGWGGSSRFYYMDLSAGPSYWTNELPVQVASQLRGISTSNYYGKLWMSKFVGSYVYGAVNNLFAPDQLYPVNYSQNYNLQLFVLDNRTAAEMSQGPQLTATINETMIQQNLASLVPF